MIALQRDNGDRGDRRRARLKYVVDDHGLDWVARNARRIFRRAAGRRRRSLELAIPELLGWHEQGDGKWWLGVPVPAGRIEDSRGAKLRTALRTIVAMFGAWIRC